jgi:CheY-like chemotaxis protein
MPPEVQARAFEPFFTTKHPGKGTGLGLSTIYGFVQQSGGTAAIESEAGAGTTVYLYLPRAPAAEVNGARKASSGKPAAEALAGLHVLLVEDEAQVRELARSMLEEMGCKVTCPIAATPRSAHLGQRSDISLLFTDCMMPGRLDGAALALEARRRRPDLPVLFTSGIWAGVDRIGTDTHNLAFLPKPYTAEQLSRRSWHSSTTRSWRRRSRRWSPPAGAEIDDDFGRLGLVGHQAGAVRVAPARQLHHLARVLGGRLGRLHHVQAADGEEERVVAEQLVQLRDGRMILGKRHGFELAQGAVDPFGGQFHIVLLVQGFSESAARMRMRDGRRGWRRRHTGKLRICVEATNDRWSRSRRISPALLAPRSDALGVRDGGWRFSQSAARHGTPGAFAGEHSS